MLAAWWAVAGVAVLLGDGAWRLAVRGLGVVRAGLSPGEWLALAAITAFFVYVEGVRALQRRFAPHVVDRACELRTGARLLWRVLGPLYAFGLVGARPAAMLRAWAGVTAIVAAVLIVRELPEPWRGIVDVAVAAALLWGTIALVLEARRRLR